MTAGGFNPATSQVRMAVQANPLLLPSAAGFKHFRFRPGEALTPNFTLTEDDSISASGDEEEGIASTIETGPKAIPVNWFPEDHGLFLASLLGVDAPTDLGGGAAYLHKITPHAAGSPNSFAPLLLHFWRDDGRPVYLLGSRLSQATFALEKPGLLNGSIQLAWEEYTRYDYATQETGTGSDLPQARGLPRYDLKEIADGDLWVEIQSYVAGVITYRAKIGAASSYNTTDQTVAEDTWSDDVTDETDALVGTRDIPVRLYFPAGTYVATDEFRIRREADLWAQALPTKYAMSETLAEIRLDGVVFPLTSFGLTVNRPIDIPDNIGGRFRGGIGEVGVRSYELTLDRRMIDTAILSRLEAGEPFEFESHCYSGVPLIAGDKDSEPRISMISKRCIISGEPSGVSSGTERQTESITAKCHPSADVTYPSPVTFEVVNSQAVLS